MEENEAQLCKNCGQPIFYSSAGYAQCFMHCPPEGAWRWVSPRILPNKYCTEDTNGTFAEPKESACPDKV